VASVTSNEQDTAVQGLNPGVRIATSGFDRLENGVRVTVRTPAPRQAQGQAQAQRGQPAAGTASKSTNGGTGSQ
jgi:multidrug efflux system membrane fusion protein